MRPALGAFAGTGITGTTGGFGTGAVNTAFATTGSPATTGASSRALTVPSSAAGAYGGYTTGATAPAQGAPVAPSLAASAGFLSSLTSGGSSSILLLLALGLGAYLLLGNLSDPNKP